MAYTPVPYGSPITGGAGATVYYGADVRPSRDGLVLVVGEPNYNGARGQVYTYDWNGTAYVQRGSAFSAGDAAASNSFGQSVCVGSGDVPGDNNLLIVGAYAGTVTGTSKGKFYTYKRTGSTWTKALASAYGEQANSTPVTGEGFGISCALSEDGKLLAISAYYYTGGTATQGGIRIYTRSGGGGSDYIWTALGSMIVNTVPVTNERFGRGVWFNKDGTVLAVSISGYDGSYVDQGAVAIFDWNASASAWQRRTNLLLVLPYGATSESFGMDVALSDDGLSMAVVAEAYDDLYTNEGCTRIYDYDVNSATWVLRHLYVGAVRAINQYPDGLGSTGNLGVVFTGYSRRDVSGNANQGSVDMTIVTEGALPGAYGYPSVPKLTTTGYLATPLTMTGAVTLPSITVAGSGTPQVSLTGSATLPLLQVAGSAQPAVMGVGACTLPRLTATGAGGPQTSLATLPALTITGTALVGTIGAGTCVLPKVTASGAGHAGGFLSGVLTLPRLTAAGTALTGIINTAAALRLPRLRTSGTLRGGVGGSAAIMLPKLVVTSTAALGHTLAGVTRLPKIKVTGLRL